MTEDQLSPDGAIPLARRVLGAIPSLLVLGVGSGGLLWLYTHLYVNPASAECVALYRAAKTAADTLMVDHSFPPSATRNAQPRTCGFVRTTARWH